MTMLIHELKIVFIILDYKIGLSQFVDEVLEEGHFFLEAFALADAQDQVSRLIVLEGKACYGRPVVENVLRKGHTVGVLAQQGREAEGLSHRHVGLDDAHGAALHIVLLHHLSPSLGQGLVHAAQSLAGSADLAHEDGFEQGRHGGDLKALEEPPGCG
jgi:hypothetical protein